MGLAELHRAFRVKSAEEEGKRRRVEQGEGTFGGRTDDLTRCKGKNDGNGKLLIKGSHALFKRVDVKRSKNGRENRFFKWDKKLRTCNLRVKGGALFSRTKRIKFTGSPQKEIEGRTGAN